MNPFRIKPCNRPLSLKERPESEDPQKQVQGDFEQVLRNLKVFPDRFGYVQCKLGGFPGKYQAISRKSRTILGKLRAILVQFRVITNKFIATSGNLRASLGKF